MRPFVLLVITSCLLISSKLSAQLQATVSNDAIALAQKIAGEGVTISNVTMSGGSAARGFFVHHGGTMLGIDSGVVLTTGRVKSGGFNDGIEGDGFTPAYLVDATNALTLLGDADLANAIGVPLSETRDACILEFDFVPIGDTIRFNYVFSSEEYTPSFVCEYNDAFAFFISGPGIVGMKNIALVPGSNIPVSIFNVNNVQDPFDPLCPNNIAYYIDNQSNTELTHDGHTTVLTAVSEVQPCQVYHLKIVIVDVQDGSFDSAVFIEAESLRSDPLRIDGHTPLNEFDLPYLAEGCVPGAIHVTRARKKSYPQTLDILVAGTATNGVDVNPIPLLATIPANDSVVVIPVIAVQDFVTEGVEILKIYIGNSCAGFYSDSITIELRDIDILEVTPDTAIICRNSGIQLAAATGYLNYAWTNSGSLSVPNIHNPIATPTSATTSYVCTAVIGNCIAQDSVLVKWKTINLVSKTDVPCRGGTNGALSVSGNNWEAPVSFAIGSGPFQSSGNFTGLAAGIYWVKLKDNSGCEDSIQVEIEQSFPDINITTSVTAATCSLVPDGSVIITASGGSGSFNYSSNGTTYQSSNTLLLTDGSYTIYVKDGNGCIATETPVIVPKINTIELDAGTDEFLCEGTSLNLAATSNVTNISWSPTTALVNTTTLTPTANPVTTIKYFVTARDGSCTRIDSLIVNVWPAPVPNAGLDTAICFGVHAVLHGAGGTEFIWSAAPSFITPTNLQHPSVKPGTTSSYYLHVRDANGCHSLQHDEVKVEVTPAVRVFAGNDTLVAVGQPLQLRAIETNASGVNQWSWTSTSFLDNPFIASPVATFADVIAVSPYEYVYTVTGTTPVGCQGSDEIRIKVYKGPEIYVPTAFTPNRDGRNELLIGLPVGLKEFRYLKVFNRWGQMLFFSKDPLKGWDGTIMGVDQPTSVFIWMAEGVDYTGKLVTRKGTTTLIR